MSKTENLPKAPAKPVQISTRQMEGVPAGQEYVDPFLFDSGHFASREEYDELSRTAKVRPRARA